MQMPTATAFFFAPANSTVGPDPTAPSAATPAEAPMGAGKRLPSFAEAVDAALVVGLMAPPPAALAVQPDIGAAQPGQQQPVDCVFPNQLTSLPASPAFSEATPASAHPFQAPVATRLDLAQFTAADDITPDSPTVVADIPPAESSTSTPAAGPLIEPASEQPASDTPLSVRAMTAHAIQKGDDHAASTAPQHRKETTLRSAIRNAAAAAHAPTSMENGPADGELNFAVVDGPTPPPERVVQSSNDERRASLAESLDAPGRGHPAPAVEPRGHDSSLHLNQARPPVRIADQISDAVAAHLERSSVPGRTEILVRLNPPELGEVRVHLATQDDLVSGRVVVRDDAVRAILESQLPELRQRLEQAGISLGRFDVAHDQGGQGRSDHPHPTPWPRGLPPWTPPAQRAMHGAVPVHGSRGLIDIVA